jgi:SHS2 domain-containing protein
MSGSGHRLMPHTADLTVTSWAPSREECLVEAVHGLVDSFADTGGVGPVRRVPFSCSAGPDTEVLVRLLEEVIYLLDTADVVPVHVVAARSSGGGLTGHFDVADRGAVRPVGPAPKAVTRHHLSLASDAGTWRCSVTVDV